ncbi:hypothetical protein CDD82_1763 [Ophiocordyceps australis]|uniref:Uncharacterized protein n=1 Tax=Ophiocordyceps australis TaxID=1399860 RepID=A0A2C5ZH94_9HYPO|nr:hypothetical protein CDD82_1763 [Ophiocordyceps australis]
MAGSDESASIASEELSSASSKSSSSGKEEQGSMQATGGWGLDKRVRGACEQGEALVQHVQRCIQTRAGNDVVLMFICYASRLSGTALSMVSRALRQQQGGAATRRASRQAGKLAGRMEALSSMISETRAVGRLWGLLGLYLAGRSAGQKGMEEGMAASALAQAQIASLIIFQAAENIALLGSKKIVAVGAAAQERLGVLSVRAWGVYVMLELVRLLHERMGKRKKGMGGGGGGGGGEKGEVEEWSEAEDGAWKRSFAQNLAWAPLTVHWGVKGGVLAEWVVSVLAMYPATGAMRDLWRETA